MVTSDKLQQLIKRAKEHRNMWNRFYDMVDELIDKDPHGFERFLDIMTKEDD